MAIAFYGEQKTFKLDTPRMTYLMQVYKEGYLLNLYAGASIPDTYVPDRVGRRRSASFSPSNPVLGEGLFSPDTAPIEYGCNGAGDFRTAALSVENKNGDTVTDMRYISHRIYAGKEPIPGQPSTYVSSSEEADTLEITLRDPVTGITCILFYTVFKNHDVITRRARIQNATDTPCGLERAFSLCMDLPDMNYDLITLYGRHGHERSIERRHLAHGIQGAESRRGVSSHAQNPFMALISPNGDEDKGEVFGFNLVYSGNFSALAECDFNGTTRVLLGINPTDFFFRLAPGECFDTPEAVTVYSDEGLGGMSRAFHDFYREHLIRGKYKTEKRPLLINSWEAAFFDFDTEKLVNFAKNAKELGMELLVMDDGWFGKRNDDRSSLGDWTVNEEKLPGGLSELVRRVNAEGMKFGIWYEPEMISPDSELFRAHPDWCVHVEGRDPMIARNQYVLDVSREDVRENIWGQMEKVLSNNNIEYVKWDFNRNISDAGSAILPRERKGEFFHRFILGTYDLMNRLVTSFPDILFENCSGGGGRFDPAMLCYSPQIWTSDNTCALDRLEIQYGTSLCYPACAMGAHISADSQTDYETKANVALWGTFGMELDPGKLTGEEREIIRKKVAQYHRDYDLVHKGDLYRLLSPFEDKHRAAWQLVSKDKRESTVTVVCMKSESHSNLFLKLRGLDPKGIYREETTGLSASGALLMNAGLNVGTKQTSQVGKSISLHFVKE